jgi:hypothetical protein
MRYRIVRNIPRALMVLAFALTAVAGVFASGNARQAPATVAPAANVGMMIHALPAAGPGGNQTTDEHAVCGIRHVTIAGMSFPTIYTSDGVDYQFNSDQWQVVLKHHRRGLFELTTMIVPGDPGILVLVSFTAPSMSHHQNHLCLRIAEHFGLG